MKRPSYEDDDVAVYHGDCLDVLRTLPDASVDAVVTDPPYGLEFMGREWDKFDQTPQAWATREATAYADPENRGQTASPFLAAQVNKFAAGAPFQAWCEQWAAECLRVLKPGGHLLAFGGTRTWHRLACAVEDAGFEVRDSIAWLYGSGFPKSLDVSKAIRKAAGAEREVVREWPSTYSGGSGAAAGYRPRNYVGKETSRGAVTDDARTWQGWGTALKPAFEPVVVARKPLAGTVAANVLAHGTGALNIDGCRTEMSESDREKYLQGMDGWRRHGESRGDGTTKAAEVYGTYGLDASGPHQAGRWPPNVVLDDTAAAELDRQSGATASGKPRGAASGDGWGMTATGAEYDDQGGASRFFPTFRYEPKAPTAERPRAGQVAHPTVKPLDLMRWLTRLVTPPGGTVLDPFAGTGTTAEACIIEGFRCVAVEREADYLPLIVARITKPIQPDLFGGGT